jgi:hypothetical protein
VSIPRPTQPSMGPYAVVPGWVLALELTHAQLAIYLALRLHCDRDRRAWPSQETLAQEARTDERTVRRALVRFQELGLLTAERVRGFGTGSRMLYTLNDLPLPDTGVLQLPDTGVLQVVPTGHQRPIATGHQRPSYRTPVTELPDTRVLQKGTAPRTAPEQLSRVSAREAPPDRPLTGSAAPADESVGTVLHERADSSDTPVIHERAETHDRPVPEERAQFSDSTEIGERTPARWADRNPPMPAGSATRHTPTMWVTPPAWRPAPEFDEATARRGLAMARAALRRAETEATERVGTDDQHRGNLERVVRNEQHRNSEASRGDMTGP